MTVILYHQARLPNSSHCSGWQGPHSGWHCFSEARLAGRPKCACSKPESSWELVSARWQPSTSKWRAPRMPGWQLCSVTSRLRYAQISPTKPFYILHYTYGMDYKLTGRGCACGAARPSHACLLSFPFHFQPEGFNLKAITAALATV